LESPLLSDLCKWWEAVLAIFAYFEFLEGIFRLEQWLDLGNNYVPVAAAHYLLVDLLLGSLLLLYECLFLELNLDQDLLNCHKLVVVLHF